MDLTWRKPVRLVHEALLATASAVPGKDAVVDEYGTATYAELRDDALRFARVLQDSNVRRGDRVVLYLDNTADCSAAIFGVMLAGGVFTVVNTQTKADKLALILNDCEATVLVAEGHKATIAAEAAARTPSLARVLATAGPAGSALPDNVGDFRATIDTMRPEPDEVGTIPPDLAALIYTSGTTGRPKGVMLSHDSLVFAIGSIGEYLGLTSEDRVLSVLPLAFTYGLGQLLLTVGLGATLLLERSFTFPARTLSRLRAERATVFPAAPTIYATILNMSHPEPYGSVRCLTNAAAGLPPALHEGLRRLFPNALLYRMYGQTECMRVCYLEPELIDRKPTSVGKAIPGTEAIVLDDFGNPVEPGETGILHVRGPHIMMGYWRAPELTARHLREGPYPGERMLCTYDHFTVDADGDLYFVDRSDDIIKTRGEKVSSVEVENALHDIDGVKQAAVIGVPDDLLGEAVRAYVVLREDVRLNEQDIIRICRSKLENFMVPREVRLVEALPQTDSGKVRKKSLVPAGPGED